MADPRKPKKENYVECPECSAAAGGEPVLYHKSSLETGDDMWDERETVLCPKGHVIPKVPA